MCDRHGWMEQKLQDNSKITLCIPVGHGVTAGLSLCFSFFFFYVLFACMLTFFVHLFVLLFLCIGFIIYLFI